MSAQGDSEFLVQRARELVPQDLWAAKAWLITARSLYPADFNIQVRSGPPRPPRMAGRAPRPAAPPVALLPTSRSPAPLGSQPSPSRWAARSPLEVGAGRVAGLCAVALQAAQHRVAPGRPLAHSFITVAAICSASPTFEILSQLVLGAEWVEVSPESRCSALGRAATSVVRCHQVMLCARSGPPFPRRGLREGPRCWRWSRTCPGHSSDCRGPAVCCSMRCTRSSGMPRGLPPPGGCCTTCE